MTGVRAAASLGETMSMSQGPCMKRRISAICFSLLSSAEQISTVASSWRSISRLISSFIFMRQSSWLHWETQILYFFLFFATCQQGGEGKEHEEGKESAHGLFRNRIKVIIRRNAVQKFGYTILYI